MFNNYDLLREPLVIDENADYYCLTDDKNLFSQTWNCVYISEMDTDKLTGVQKTYMTKYSFYKYLPKNYDYYVTIDASIEVADKLTRLIEFSEDGGYNIGLSMHPVRKNWNSEYSCWVRNRGLDKKYVEIFNNYVKECGHGLNPHSDNGLIECTVKIYKNDKEVFRFIDEVYEVLKNTNNFEDKNEQCYLTCILYDYMVGGGLQPFFFTRQLYSNSKYFNSYYHKTNSRWINNVRIERNTNELFGKKVKLNEF
jgi:hypothetical protein